MSCPETIRGVPTFLTTTLASGIAGHSWFPARFDAKPEKHGQAGIGLLASQRRALETHGTMSLQHVSATGRPEFQHHACRKQAFPFQNMEKLDLPLINKTNNGIGRAAVFVAANTAVSTE
jgi:hypothetical protein